MIILENNATTLNEIIFKNRNKSYGAYVMRSEYGNTILKSLGLTVLIFASISLIALWLNNTVEADKKLDTGENIIKCYDYKVEVDVTPIKKEEKIIQRLATNSSTAALSTNLNDHAVEQRTEVIQTAEVTNNPTGQTANPDAATGEIGGNNPTGTGESPDVGMNKPIEPILAPDVMPKFDNMAAFLQRNLRYPTMALEGNVSGKVIVNFVIDEEGRIEKATVLKGIGYGCDEEALRVIKLMLKWTPGMFKGKPARVSFNQAIVFRLQ